jgi:hypothetical protein
MICTVRVFGKESDSTKRDLDSKIKPRKPWRPREAKKNGHKQTEDAFIGGIEVW